MGCSFSCNSSSRFKHIIRIVHLNTYIEELDYPVTVGEVTGKPAKHFLFTHAQLLASGSSPLKSEAVLEAGRVYFLLPQSLFDSGVSPLDLAPLARKLASAAQKSRSKSKPEKQNVSSDVNNNIPVWSSSNETSPVNRYYSDRSFTRTDNGNTLGSSKLRSWKPILATISERSFNRRSESDLPDIGKADGAE